MYVRLLSVSQGVSSVQERSIKVGSTAGNNMIYIIPTATRRSVIRSAIRYTEIAYWRSVLGNWPSAAKSVVCYSQSNVFFVCLDTHVER